MPDEPKQIKSRERVREHAEVYTAEREVKAMCDLVKDETERIDSRFLEPACGTGNFLAEILSRKLAVARSQYGRSENDFLRASIVALSSVYGVELLQDNAEECRARLLALWNEAVSGPCSAPAVEEAARSAAFVLGKNILCGNALTLKCVDAEQRDLDEPIVFAEWSIVSGDLVKRRDFRLDVLLEAKKEPGDMIQCELFGDGAKANANWDEDPETKTRIPRPIREFPPTDYRRLSTMEETPCPR